MSRANEFWNPIYFSCATNSSEVCKALTRGLINQDIRQNGQDIMFIISEKNCGIIKLYLILYVFQITIYTLYTSLVWFLALYSSLTKTSKTQTTYIVFYQVLQNLNYGFLVSSWIFILSHMWVLHVMVKRFKKK